MNRLGLLARADDGGIGAQSWGFYWNMHPEKVLVCHTEHKTRGFSQPQRFMGDNELRTCRRAPRPQDIDWLLDGIDSVFSVECWYGEHLPIAARAKGVKTVLQVNPEMSGFTEAADVLLAPTDWRLDALPPQTRVLPFPTDLDLMRPRDFEVPTRTMYHINSSAMNDRNGTDSLLAACDRMTVKARLLIRGGTPRMEFRGPVAVTWLGHSTQMFHEAWPGGIDAFVIPRRYGGLCLPMQEAASLGLPIITTDLPPQRSWLPMGSLVPAHLIGTEQMRGGSFDIFEPDVQQLARVLDELCSSDTRAQQLADRAYTWANSISWEALRPAYEEILR